MELHLSSCIQVNLNFQNGWHQKKTLQNDINIAWNNINISKHWGMTGIFDIKSVVQKTRALRSIDTQLTNHYKHWLWRIAVAIHLRSTEMWMETAPQPSDRGGLMRWRSGKCWKIHKPRKLRGISEILFYKGWGMNERESTSTFLKGKIRKKNKEAFAKEISQRFRLEVCCIAAAGMVLWMYVCLSHFRLANLV